MTDNVRLPIVVGIDGSIQSLAALRWAFRQAGSSGAPVHVVHCWQPQTVTDLAFDAPHTFARASICMLDNEIAAALNEMEVKPEVEPISVHGRPATTLLNEADGAAMLVLGAHGHTALRDVVFGQVIRSCEKHAGCPVVVVDEQGYAVQENTRTATATGS